MSRLSKKPIKLESGMTAEKRDGALHMKGPKGECSVKILPGVSVDVQGDSVTIRPTSDEGQSRANAGTTWSLARSALQGLSSEFLKVLEIEGVGYRAALEGNTLLLHLGYVHPVKFPFPKEVKIEIEKSVIKVSGQSKDLVGRIAAQIRAFKKPEPYKGKGIRYQGEVIRRKVGKKAATATGGA